MGSPVSWAVQVRWVAVFDRPSVELPGGTAGNRHRDGCWVDVEAYKHLLLALPLPLP